MLNENKGRFDNQGRGRTPTRGITHPHHIPRPYSATMPVLPVIVGTGTGWTRVGPLVGVRPPLPVEAVPPLNSLAPCGHPPFPSELSTPLKFGMTHVYFCDIFFNSRNNPNKKSAEIYAIKREKRVEPESPIRYARCNPFVRGTAYTTVANKACQLPGYPGRGNGQAQSHLFPIVGVTGTPRHSRRYYLVLSDACRNGAPSPWRPGGPQSPLLLILPIQANASLRRTNVYCARQLCRPPGSALSRRCYHPASTATQLKELVRETVALVEQYMPQIDTTQVHRMLEWPVQAWEPM